MAVTFGDKEESPPLVPFELSREHTEYGWCWCQPTVSERVPDGEVIVHRLLWDAPDE